MQGEAGCEVKTSVGEVGEISNLISEFCTVCGLALPAYDRVTSSANEAGDTEFDLIPSATAPPAVAFEQAMS